MHIIMVANPKGGCGKTTVSTQLAGHYANAGWRVGLFDLDRQQSALKWLRRRPETCATIEGFDARDKDAIDDIAPHLDVAVVDAPAGLRGDRLKEIVRQADHLVVPVQPSPFDMDATDDFLALLIELKRVRKGRCAPALIANRVNPRALSARELDTFLQASGLPVLGALRDTQIYVQLAASGTTLFDLPAHRVARDLDAWQPLLDWLAAPPEHD